MFQESASSWDLRYRDREPSIGLLFLVIVASSTTVKLAKTWRMAPPLRLSKHPEQPVAPLKKDSQPWFVTFPPPSP